MSKRQRWIVMADPARSLDAVRDGLIRRGCTIESMLKEIGAIVVSSNGLSRSDLADIEGIESVEPDSDIDIGQPGAPGTW